MISILDNSERKKAGDFVEEYFNIIKLGRKEDIQAFISFIYSIYKNNSYLVKREKSIRGKSILPACYIKINSFTKIDIEVLDENWETIELNKVSVNADKSSIKFLQHLNDKGFMNVYDALCEEKLSFIKMKEGGILIYPSFLKEKVENYFREK